MEFIETQAYRKIISDLVTDEQHREIQNQFLERPDLGTPIPGAFGLRKARFGLGTQGKRGGLRLWYAHFPERQVIILTYALSKNEGSDLTRDMTKRLGQAVRQEYK